MTKKRNELCDAFISAVNSLGHTQPRFSINARANETSDYIFSVYTDELKKIKSVSFDYAQCMEDTGVEYVYGKTLVEFETLTK